MIYIINPGDGYDVKTTESVEKATAWSLFYRHPTIYRTDGLRLQQKSDLGWFDVFRLSPSSPPVKVWDAFDKVRGTMREPINITRTQAAKTLNEILEMLSAARTGDETETLFKIRNELCNIAGLDLLTRCPGEAHDPKVGGSIDNCSVCAPRWGWVGPAIEVS